MAGENFWIYGDTDVSGDLVHDGYHQPSTDGRHFVLYADNPRGISEAVLQDPRLAGLICPTPSPYSHDANLMRVLAKDLGIVCVCGIKINHVELDGSAVVISPRHQRVLIGGELFQAAATLAGSDETVAYIESIRGVCYRPFYLYDAWLGTRICAGLTEGLGRLIGNPTSAGILDAQGRAWLTDGPRPREIAGWIFEHKFQYLELLKTLTLALQRLTVGRWRDSEVLTCDDFLAEFDHNCVVAPFVGFPLYSLTKQATEQTRHEPDGDLDRRVMQMSELVRATDRQQGRIAAAAFSDIYESLSRLQRADLITDSSIAAAAVLMSDVRRLVITDLRLRYSSFEIHTRHRKWA